ncbi:MAG: AsmA family protein [Candidatus Omnitrophota bacterium]
MKIIEKIITFLGIVFLIIAVLSFALFWMIKNIKAKDLIERRIERDLGINVTIEKLELSPLLTFVKAEGITIHNPEGFNEDELAYIASLSLIWDPLEMVLSKKPNIYLVALDLERLNVVKNQQGRINIKELIPIKEEEAPSEDKTSPYLNTLILSIKEVNYTNYAAAVKQTHKYTINMKNQLFIDLKDGDELMRLVIYKAIQNTDIGRLVNLTVRPIVSNVTDTVDAALGTAKAGAKGALEIAWLPFKLLFNK